MTNDRTRVVGIGGGTGLSALLAGLLRASQAAWQAGHGAAEIAAVVSVADDGGSTGRLRRHLGLPGVGDLRNCIVALAHGDPLWNDLFQHRFDRGDGLDGHALGNLIMAALIERSGGLQAAIDELTRPLRLGGRVLPATEEPVTLCAELDDGEVVLGESQIPGRGKRISRVWLHPRAPRPARGVLETLAGADAVVLGPGSLYTSVIPNLLVGGVVDALRTSGALRIFVCNLMTEPGETDGIDAAGHLRAIEGYLGTGAVDVCLLDAAEPPPELAARYAAAGSRPVPWTRRSIEETGALPVVADLRARGGLLDRHDAHRLGDVILALAQGAEGCPGSPGRGRRAALAAGARPGGDEPEDAPAVSTGAPAGERGVE